MIGFGSQFYHWTNINNIKKYLPEFHHRDFSEIIGLRLHLAGVLLLLLHLDDVMNLNVISHIETVEHLNVPNISTAHHNPPFMKNILTEMIHHDVTNLHGLLHLIVLAIHSAVDHQLDILNVVRHV